MPTWTPDALAREARPFAGTCWRLVEAQHIVSTLKLVDSLAEQAVLEELLEETKPPVPPECQRLHYLLKTPFRYGAAYPVGSRFRRAGRTPGVYYASEAPETAVAEMAFYRLLFFLESPGAPRPTNPLELTAFSMAFATGRGIDLTVPNLSADRAAWTHKAEYAPCQALAETARSAAAEVIRYESVRDPAGGANVALLTCSAFAARAPAARRTWRLYLSPSGVQALCEHPERRLEFPRGTFADDPRIAALGRGR